MAIWGAIYVRDLLRFLEAPGLPVHFAYTSKAGVVDIRADSYTIYPVQGVAIVSGLSVSDPKGTFARIERIEASGIKWRQLGNQVIHIRAVGTYARLTRLKNGGIDLEQVLPSQQGPPSKTPFQVALDRVRISLIDQMGPRPWTQEIQAKNVRVSGVGADWIASTTADLPGIGTTPLRIESRESEGIDATIDVRELQLAPTIAHFRETPPLKNTDLSKFSAESVEIVGPVHVFLPYPKSDSLPSDKRANAEVPLVEAGITAKIRMARYQKYQVDNLTFAGRVSTVGVVGKISATTGPNHATFNGSARWSKAGGVLAAGEISVESPNEASLPAPVRSFIPRGATFNAVRFSGWGSYRSGLNLKRIRYALAGRLTARETQYRHETISQLDSQLRIENRTVAANVRSASYRGRPISGFFSLDIPSRFVSGTASAISLDLGKLADGFNFPGLSGTASLVVSFGGTIQQPEIYAHVTGDALYRQSGQRIGGHFDLGATYQNSQILVRRAVATGDFGLLSATGKIGLLLNGGKVDLNQGKIDLSVVGRGLSPSVFDPQLNGRANLVLAVTGVPSDPRFVGRIESYNLDYKSYLIPAASANFAANLTGARLSEIRATRGATELRGDGSIHFKDKSLGGALSVEGLQVADLLGESFAGSVDIPDVRIGGSISNPKIIARLAGRNIVAQGIKADDVSADLSVEGDVARVVNATATVAGGRIDGEAHFNLKRSQGTAKLRLTGIGLGEVVPKLSSAVAVAGTAGGVIAAEFGQHGLTNFESSGHLKGVTFNDTPVGDGPWSIGLDHGNYVGNVQVGSLDRYISLEDFTFNPSNRNVLGQINLFNAEVPDLIAISSRYLPNLSVDTQNELKSADGLVNVGIKIRASVDGSTLNVRSVDVQTLEASALKFRELNLGSISTSLSMENDRWDLHRFLVSGGVVRADAKGYIDIHGNSDLSVTVGQVSLSELGHVVPELAGQSGEVTNLSIDVSGVTKTPDIHASVELADLLMKPQDIAAIAAIKTSKVLSSAQKELQLQAVRDRSLELSLVGDLSGTGKDLTIDGNYLYRGFTGKIAGNVPVDIQSGVPKDGKVTASVSLAKRDLKQIAPLLGGLDITKVDGTVQGSLVASGTLDNLTVTGSIDLLAKSLGFEVPSTAGNKPPFKVDDGFKNVTASVGMQSDVLRLKVEADSSRSGHLSVDLSSPIDELRSIKTEVEKRGLEAILRNKVSGKVILNALTLRQGFADRTYVGGTANGQIDIDGTIAHPEITGAIALSKVNSVLPTFQTSGGGTLKPPIDPSFRVRVSLSDPAELRTATADLTLLGGGNITGTLAVPNVQSNLEVESGSVRLPGSLIRLDQGGSVSLTMAPTAGEEFTTVDVDMTGRTSLTALKYGTNYERYDITIGLKGDLLKEGGLALTAQSDPPDLTQDRILALLGQTDLLQSLNSGVSQSDTEKKFRDAFTGFALPTLADPITSPIAKLFNLDTLTVEYNSYELASVAFAKSFGNGFTFQGRSQIGEPPPGFKPLYDLRIVYHPRRLRGVLSNFSLSIGADQDRPIKGALEYGIKF